MGNMAAYLGEHQTHLLQHLLGRYWHRKTFLNLCSLILVQYATVCKTETKNIFLFLKFYTLHTLRSRGSYKLAQIISESKQCVMVR